jgi:hypothetical protein
LQTPATPAAPQFSLQLDMQDLQVNKLPPNPQLWTMPTHQGYPPVNLADPNLRVAPPSGAAVPAGAARPIQPPLQR